ncbi:MAG: ABC transporter permease, partial [Planctomycetes bacterium]|nr:ABC transporter permease [Planctomycetota bacterium]
GGIDLSAGSVMAFSGTICSVLMLALQPDAFLESKPISTSVIAIGIAGALTSGLLIGSLHAWLITRIGLPPFIATLGTLVGLRSLGRAIIDSATLTWMGGASSKINVQDRTFRELSGGFTGTVWTLTILAIALSFLLWGMMSKTVVGRHLYALGGNEQAARLSGIRTEQLKWLAYCVSAVLSSLAGILFVSRLGVADPESLGRGYELNAIAAAVVGGCSLQGGVGTIPGTLLGAFFLRVVIDGVAKIIKTGANLYEGLIVGVLVVFAVTFTGRQGTIVGRIKLFQGPLGWVAILNLTLLSSVMMALMGIKIVEGRTQMNALWLASLAAGATFSLLLLVHCELTVQTKRKWGIVWTIAVIVASISADIAFPRSQRYSAMKMIQKTGGSIAEGENGIIVDLNGSRCDDSTLKQLVPRLKFFRSLSEIRLRDTSTTDTGLEVLRKHFSTPPGLKRLDLTGTKTTTNGLNRLKRSLSETETLPK